ncbi:AAA family ATPase [Paenibacillus agilis]|uniref:AAA family ATPase n=1 Tax=Paenibacillus agilis TaxID=3020863 RepID=A0A559IYB2_9BACL|nr:AAA family ATPase [Paenibacillus agilis]TVX92608.1 AAA family ATPase [Paenibacillus agilis]
MAGRSIGIGGRYAAGRGAADMRIERVDIERLGHLYDKSYSFSTHGLTVILGPNESGKSTITDAIKMMLYGRPKRTSDRYGLAGEQVFAGRMEAADAHDRRWLLTRSNNKADGGTAIQRLSNDGAIHELRQSDMERELLGGVHPELFCRLFAISLDELHAVHTLQGDELRAFMYDSGFQAGRSVVLSEQSLQQELERLYKQRGRTQPIAVTLNNIDRVHKMKRDADRLQGKLQLLYEEQEQLKQLRSNLHDERAQCKQARGWTERALHISDDWVHLLSIKGQLTDLQSSASWHTAWDERWETFSRERERLELREEQVELDKQRIILELRRLSPRKEVLQFSAEVKRLVSMVETVRHWADSARELTQEIDSCEADLQLLARQSGANWTAEQLYEKDWPSSLGHEVESMQLESERILRDKHTASQEHARKLREYSELTSGFEQAKLACEAHRLAGAAHSGWSPAGSEIDRIQRLWAQLQDAEERLLRYSNSMAPVSVGQHESASDDGSNGSLSYRGGRAARNSRKTGQSSNRITAYILMLMGTCTAAVLGFNGLWLAAGVLFIIGIVGASISLFLLGERKQELSEHPAMPTDASHAETAQQITVIREEIVKGLKPVLATVSAQHQGERKEMIVQSAWQMVLDWKEEGLRLERRQQLSADEVEQAGRRIRISAQEVEAAIQNAELHNQVWQTWLQEHALPESWSPASVQEHLRRVEQAIQLQQQTQRLRERELRLWDQVQSYWNECYRIMKQANQAVQSAGDEYATSVGITGITIDSKLIPAVSIDSKRWIELRELLFSSIAHLQEQMEQEEHTFVTFRQLEQQRRELELKHEELQAERIQASRMYQQLWEEAGTSGEDEFLALQRQAAAYRQLRTELRQVEAICYRGGTEAEFIPIEALLIKHDKQALAQRVDMLLEQVRRHEEQQREVEQKFGRIQQEIDSVKQRIMSEHIVQEQASLEAKLDAQTERYAVHAIAKTLIRRTRQRYEEEKQPLVFQRASHYLQRMTEGRYVRVLTPFGSESISVERKDGKLFDSLQLSRGTAEQVYLAMRFALADGMSERTALPFVWDDIFVNFDEARLRATLACLPELLVSHQVIWTTCHTHMVDVLLDIVPDAHVLKVDG